MALKDAEGNLVNQMANDNETLEFYGAQNNFIIHVTDNDPSAVLQGLDDLSQVEKYKISEEKYAARENTFRKFK